MAGGMGLGAALVPKPRDNRSAQVPGRGGREAISNTTGEQAELKRCSTCIHVRLFSPLVHAYSH